MTSIEVVDISEDDQQLRSKLIDKLQAKQDIDLHAPSVMYIVGVIEGIARAGCRLTIEHTGSDTVVTLTCPNREREIVKSNLAGTLLAMLEGEWDHDPEDKGP